jgi:hypothetical protein
MPPIDPNGKNIPAPVDADLVHEVLKAHRGDVRAAIAGLLEDVDYLQGEIAYASLALSRGFTRGWTPSFRRMAEDRRAKDKGGT